MESVKNYVAVRRFNRYRIGQPVYEVGAKLQGLLRRGLIEEVKIAPPPETKTAAPAVTPVETKANVKPRPKRRRRKPATAA